MGAAQTGQIGRVFDPDLSVETQRRLMRKARWYYSDMPEWIGGIGATISIIWVIITSILHFVIGLPWVWMAGIIILGPVSYAAYKTAVGYGPNNAEWDRVVESVEVDKPDRTLFSRAQRAISDALGSGAYSTDARARVVEESVLRRHEWDIATTLRDLTQLSRKHAHETREEPGPMTATVLHSQERALKLARTAVTSRIRALERYAAQLKAADAAKSDWQRALKLSGANDQYLDLVARTAADEHAIAEIDNLTVQAQAAQQVYQDCLHAVALAAEALVLPDSQTGQSG